MTSKDSSSTDKLLTSSTDLSAPDPSGLKHADVCQWLQQYCGTEKNTSGTDSELWRVYREEHELAALYSTSAPPVFQQAIQDTFSATTSVVNTEPDHDNCESLGVCDVELGFHPLGVPSTGEIRGYVPRTGVEPSLLRRIFGDRVPEQLSREFVKRVAAATFTEEETGLLLRNQSQEDHGRSDNLLQLVDNAAAAFTVYAPIGLSIRLRSGYHRRTSTHYRNALSARAHAQIDLQDARATPSPSLHELKTAMERFQGAHKRVEAMRVANENNKLDHIKAARSSNDFMDLPPELRVIIYEYALATDRPIEVVVAKKDVSLTYTAPPALTLVSRMIRAEALPVYYEGIHFELHLDADRLKHGTAVNGWERGVIAKWQDKIWDLHQDGKRIGGGIISKMRALSVVFQARAVNDVGNLWQFLPTLYQEMRLDVTYDRTKGLACAVPSNLAQEWLDDSKLFADLVDNIEALNGPESHSGHNLFDFFLCHESLFSDWEFDGETNIASDGMLIARCDCA